MFVDALSLTAITVGIAGSLLGEPMKRYSSFALQQPQNAASIPAPAVHDKNVVELENGPTVDTVPLSVLSPYTPPAVP